jgi:uncharacterized protein YcbX
MRSNVQLADIRTYPVKALGGGSHDRADVEPWGLRGDRCWMVADASGQFLTQRQHPRMAALQAENIPTGLTLTDAAGDHIAVATPGERAETLTVTVWRDSVPARLAGAHTHAWLSDRLGIACRLVHLDDKTARKINPAYAADDAPVSFADGFPVLLATTASLADLNARLAHPIPITRFRPNLVIEGCAPWEEDTWRRIRIGDALFHVAKPCERCIVTTIDPVTGERPDKREPLLTLARFRRDAGGGVMFGQNLIPQQLGRIRAGDTVEVLEKGPPNVRLMPPVPVHPAEPSAPISGLAGPGMPQAQGVVPADAAD